MTIMANRNPPSSPTRTGFRYRMVYASHHQARSQANPSRAHARNTISTHTTVHCRAVCGPAPVVNPAMTITATRATKMSRSKSRGCHGMSLRLLTSSLGWTMSPSRHERNVMWSSDDPLLEVRDCPLPISPRDGHPLSRRFAGPQCHDELIVSSDYGRNWCPTDLLRRVPCRYVGDLWL